MRAALGAFVVALVVATALTPIVRRLAMRHGVVDAPGGRRVNTRQIPRMGGIAIVIAFFAPLLLLFGTQSDVAHSFFQEPLRIVGLAVGGFIVAGLGVSDDVVGVRAWHKLGVQIVAASAAWACGFRMEAFNIPLFGQLELGIFGLPLTILWIVAVVNAMNLIDGLDGLAAGIAFFACLTNFVVAGINGQVLVMLLAAALGGAILGFLLYNFNPATIFMGDSGSMFLGFVLATTSMMSASTQGSTTVAILAPILSLGVPIMDTLFATVRRILERRSIFSPDRGHIHHRLLDLGITHRRAVLILYGVSVLFTAGAITVALGRNWQVGGALLVLTIAVIGLGRFGGYFEYIRSLRERRLAALDAGSSSLRGAIPALIQRIDSVPRRELPELFGVFARSAGVATIELVAPGDADLGFRWPAAPSDEPPENCAELALDRVGPGFKLIVGTNGENTIARSAADRALLQLVADVLEARLLRSDTVRRGVAHLRPVS